MAYSLLSLFDVNMPMLYGEGDKASIRLQEEIMRTLDDMSLFAWRIQAADFIQYSGLLAAHPRDFLNSGNIVPYRYWSSAQRKPISMASLGLNITVHLEQKNDDLYSACLECVAQPQKGSGFLGIWLRPLVTGSNQFARVQCEKFSWIADLGEPMDIFVRQKVILPHIDDVYAKTAVRIDLKFGESGYKLDSVYDLQLCKTSSRSTFVIGKPSVEHMPITCSLSTDSTHPSRAIVLLCSGKPHIAILLGSNINSEVASHVLEVSRARVWDTACFTQNAGIYIKHCQAGRRTVVTNDHKIQFNITPQIQDTVKYFLVNIYVEVTTLPFEQEVPSSSEPQGGGGPSSKPQAKVVPSKKKGLFRRFPSRQHYA